MLIDLQRLQINGKFAAQGLRSVEINLAEYVEEYFDWARFAGICQRAVYMMDLCDIINREM